MIRRRRLLATVIAVAVALLVVGIEMSSSGAARTSPRTTTTRDAEAMPTPKPSPTSTPATPSPSKAPPSLIHRVVGLGDSVPAGSACSCTTYVSLVASQLAAAQRVGVTASNLASPGQTTSGLLAQMWQPSLANALRHADAVIVTVGANDLEGDGNCSPSGSSSCYADDLRALRSTYTRMLARIHALVPAQARVIVTGYWDVFLDGVVARQQGDSYVRNSNALTRAVNSLIATTAATNAATYVDVYRPFKGDDDHDDTPLLAADGDHPNAAGHRVIAQAITHTLLAA